MQKSEHLYIVATPIGNLQDITLRALDTLKSCDIIVCEDTRVTGRLLHHYGIKKPMKALNEYNEQTVAYEIIDELKAGKNICLVSDSGTPLISDPGFRLVRLAKKQSIQVVPIPGPSAVIAALSASGIPTDSFFFTGFLPKQSTKKKRYLEQWKESCRTISSTLIFYESPHRIADTLKTIQEVCDNVQVTIARELTKVHEEILTLPVQTFIDEYTKKQPKGEITVLLSLKTE